MRRLLLGLMWSMAGAGLLLLGACGDGASGLDRLSAGERGKVVSVNGGDAVTLDSGLVVRLAGIDTPYADQPGAQAAEDDLTRRLNGKAVELLYGGLRRDARGRALAQLRLTDGRAWVQGTLLSDGVARVRTYADNRAMAGAMLEDEAKARLAKRGLWGQGVYKVLLPQEISRDASGFQIVEGRVLSVSPVRSGTYLDFTSDHRGFAVLIAAAALPDLQAAGKPVAGLASHLVRVRGVVGWDGLMRIDHPEQIEVLKAK